MRLRLPRRDRRERPSPSPARGRSARSPRRAAGPLVAGLSEVAAIGREMLRIPAGIWMRAAERLGVLVLAAWRRIRPVLVAGLALARRVLAVAEREVTPARAVAAVALVAAALLAATQFLDYREVRAGVPAYAEVEEVAPPPQVSGSARTAGSAHGYLLLLAAVAAVALVVLSLLGRWRLARLLFPLGILVVLVTALIDAPNGLDEGAVAIQFEGAEARLLGPFWVELVAGGVIAMCGLLLALVIHPSAEADARGARKRRRSGRRGRAPFDRSRVQEAGS